MNLPADTPTTLTFENKDANTPHNFAIYEDDTATTPLFQGDIVTGPATVEYKHPARSRRARTTSSATSTRT